MNPEEIPTWVPFLKRTLLFRDMVPEDLDKIIVKLQPLSLPKGATLYSRGDAGDSFYLITSGQVRLLSERGGREVITAFLGRGDALGELSLLTGEPRSVTVRLDTTSEFLVLSKKDFEDVVRENPSIMIILSRIIAQRMMYSNRAEPVKTEQPQQLAVLISAVDGPVHALTMLHVAIGVVEESRKRVLLVDMGPNPGSLAKAMGMKPVLTSESMLRELDLRDPAVLRHLLSEHPSGLSVLSLPPSVLGGRLYRGIFLLMNLLRENYDFVLISLGPTFGDVEKSILEEADRWVILGQRGYLADFRKVESELQQVAPEPKKLIKVWMGDLDPAQAASIQHENLFLIPWPDELTAEYARGLSPYQALERFPKTSRALKRFVRKLSGFSVGLALGAGAALGYSLIGILKGLKKAGISIDVVAGTSMGSLVGGFFAMGMEPETIEDIATRVDKAWIYENLFWDLTLPRSGVFAGTTMLRFFQSYFGDREFHDLELPFACVATDIETGEAVILKDGRVAEAIRASCGIPLLFTPFHYQGRYLVDGGLVEPVPARTVSQLGADILISVNLTVPTGRRKSAVKERHDSRMLTGLADLARLKDLTLPEALKSPNMLEILFQMIYTMEYEIAQSRLDIVHVLMQPDLARFAWTELHRAKEIIERGEIAAEEAIPKIKALLPYFADYCKMPVRPAPWKSY